MYRQISVILLASALAGCPYTTKEKFEEIESENAALREALNAMQAQLADVSARQAATSEELASVSERLAEVRSVYKVEDGDAVIEGANLHVRSGLGETDCWPRDACNGKGNLIIGYDEPRYECVDSPESDGALCLSDNQCSGGTCAPVDRPHKTGSHNLVVGPGHSYSGYGSVVFGESSAVSGGYVSVLGGGNNEADGRRAVIVGGSSNKASGSSSVVVGGYVNTADARSSVILGGFENATGNQAHSSVVLGHHGHEVTLSDEIAPDLQEIKTIPPKEDGDVTEGQ